MSTDFIDRGRVKRVYIQGDAPYRSAPSDLNQWFVRGADGQMAPFSSFARTSWSQAPTFLSRFNGIQSYELQGSAAPGKSSGDAIATIEKLAGQIPGTSVAWSGLSYQERLSSGQAPILYGLSIIVVFLCLAALYESWSIPLAVLLIIPLGLVGAIILVTLRGLTNDVYLQIGLLTTMGLASKNAILMIEFAEQEEKKGARVIDAALAAAKIRLRPILMTSLAFIFGVLPLAISTGAGREQPDSDRHRGHRWNAYRDDPGGVLHSVVLRARPTRLPRRREGAEAPHGSRRRRCAAARARHTRAGARVMPRIAPRIAALLALTSMSACSLAPHYVRPELPVPPSWPVGDAYLRQTEAALPSPHLSRHLPRPPAAVDHRSGAGEQPRSARRRRQYRSDPRAISHPARRIAARTRCQCELQLSQIG